MFAEFIAKSAAREIHCAKVFPDEARGQRDVRLNDGAAFKRGNASRVQSAFQVIRALDVQAPFHMLRVHAGY